MHIGLIAVSGVRIYNQALIEVGLTLPGFVERAEVIASMPSLGLLTLAAVVPDRHRVTYWEVDSPDDIARLPGDFDLVAISSFTAKADVMYRAAAHYRAEGVPVVLGGLHVTLLPDEAARHADAIVVGEGEVLFPRLLADLEAGRLEPRYANRSPHDVVLANVPAPRYDLLEPSRYNRMPVQTTRGCPLACEFCAASRIFGAYKRKPIRHVVRDLRAARAACAHPFIELADDNTFVHKGWAKSLVRAIAAEDVRWFTETDITVADDPELLDLLADSGCRQLLIGLESPSREPLLDLDPANFKHRRATDYASAIERIQRRGISVNGCFVLGLDAHTTDVFDQVLRFVRDAGLTEAQVTVQTPFPGTALHRRLRSEGRLLMDTFWDRCTLFDVTYRPKQMSAAELEQGLVYLMQSLYRPDEVTRRRRLHAKNARAYAREKRARRAA